MAFSPVLVSRRLEQLTVTVNELLQRPEISSHLSSVDPADPRSQLRSDLAGLLDDMDLAMAPHPGFDAYEEMLRLLTRGRRWRSLVRRLKRALPNRKLFGFALGQLLRRLENRLPRKSEKPPLDELARHVLDLADSVSRDAVARLIVDEYLLIMCELAERVRRMGTADIWANRELVRACLGDVEDRTHQHRRLRTILKLGDEIEQSGGNFLSVKGITVLQDESQYPRVLPEFWAPWISGTREGRAYVMSRLVNERPPILELSRTRRPEVRHRNLLFFTLDLGRRTNDHPSRRADVLGSMLAFDLLVATALAMPHDLIETDVVFFRVRDERWIGSLFPLRALKATVRSGHEWSNLLQVDRLLPDYFVRWAEAGRRRPSRVVRSVTGTPTTCLRRFVDEQAYQSVFAACITRSQDRRRCVPSEAIALPQFVRGVPSVLLANVEDGVSDFRATTCADVVDAQTARLPLPVVEETDLVRTFVEMVVGPLAEQRRVLRILAAESS